MDFKTKFHPRAEIYERIINALVIHIDLLRKGISLTVEQRQNTLKKAYKSSLSKKRHEILRRFFIINKEKILRDVEEKINYDNSLNANNKIIKSGAEENLREMKVEQLPNTNQYAEKHLMNLQPTHIHSHSDDIDAVADNIDKSNNILNDSRDSNSSRLSIDIARSSSSHGNSINSNERVTAMRLIRKKFHLIQMLLRRKIHKQIRVTRLVGQQVKTIKRMIKAIQMLKTTMPKLL